MIAKIHSQAVLGIDPFPVEVEVDVTDACGAEKVVFATVGLPDAAVRESRERVRAAIRNSGFFPGQVHITVNLAPADVRKEGAFFDLAIALAILAARELLRSARLHDYAVVGELSLDGRVKAIPGVLPLALGARNNGCRGILVPRDNAPEAALVEGIDVIGVDSLAEAVGFLSAARDIPPVRVNRADLFQQARADALDFQDVKGQTFAKRALEVAAAGGHNILMIGPPGSGKTMLAKRLPTILPELTFEEAIEATKIHSIAGMLDRTALVAGRPFRAPHHTISNIALIGGGVVPRPGEVSLAHHGVLFLDELPEFQRQVLEVLRQPLEDGKVNIARAQMSLTFPARFLLCAAMNPCPCGFRGHPTHNCECQDFQIQRYLSRISGPLLDRIDLHVDVPAVPIEDLRRRRSGEPSASIRERVNRARQIQLERFKHATASAPVAVGAELIREETEQGSLPDSESVSGSQSASRYQSDSSSGSQSIPALTDPAGDTGPHPAQVWMAPPGDLFDGSDGNGELLGFPPPDQPENCASPLRSANQSDPSDSSDRSDGAAANAPLTVLPTDNLANDAPRTHIAPSSPSAPNPAPSRATSGPRPLRVSRGDDQHERVFCNAQMTASQITKHCELDGESQAMLEGAIRSFGFSARAYDRIRKVARTIADLNASETIQPEHVSEAINYRSLDRNYWSGG